MIGRGWRDGKREKKRKKREKVGGVPPFKGRGTTQRLHSRLRRLPVYWAYTQGKVLCQVSKGRAWYA